MRKLWTNIGLLQIFFALMIVIIVMFVSNYIVHKISIAEIYEKVSQNNTTTMKSNIQSFDSRFKSIDNLLHSIHGLPYNNLEGQDGKIDMFKVYMMYYNVAALATSINFIEDVIVFYDNNELAITSNGTIKLEGLFTKKYKHDLYNADYWKRLSLSKHNFSVFPAEEYLITYELFKQREKKLIMFVGNNKIRMSNKHIMILIDYEKLMKQVNQSAMIPGSSFIMLDPDRNVILSTEEDLNLVDILNDVYFLSSKEATLTRENYEYHFYKSDYNDFIYINKVPYQFVNIDSVNKANMIIMVSAIGSAVLLSILLSFYLHKPVTRITRLLGIGQGRGNDFKKIYNGIELIQLQNESYQKQMKMVDWEIRRSVFLRSLQEYQVSSELEAAMKEYAPFLLEDNYFVIVMIQMHPIVNEDVLVWQIEEIEELIQTGLQRELIESNVFHAGDMQFLALIGLEQPSRRNPLFKRIGSFITYSELHELNGFSIWSCVSKLYASDIRNCKQAYRDVMNGMIFRNVNDSVRVLDVEQIRYTSSIYFPFEQVEKLSNHILNGKVTEAVQIVTETLQENMDRNIHRNQLLHIAKAIFYQMLKHIGNGSNDNKEFYQLEIDFCQKVDHASDYSEIERALIKIVKQLANKSKADHENKLNPSFISQYIQLHYMENLYLDHMAEVAGTSPKYFSNYFKKTFGINYIEYLNKVRLSHARELLKDTNLTVSEVGEKTGYFNSSTFRTTFKKYFGISPSDYRKRG